MTQPIGAQIILFLIAFWCLTFPPMWDFKLEYQKENKNFSKFLFAIYLPINIAISAIIIFISQFVISLILLILFLIFYVFVTKGHYKNILKIAETKFFKMI